MILPEETEIARLAQFVVFYGFLAKQDLQPSGSITM